MEGGIILAVALVMATVLPASPLRAPGRNTAQQPIDRFALVTRHNVTLAALDPESPLSVGNGEFAFTVDATGLQTFPALYEQTIPLGTLSQWGWHTWPNPDGWHIDRFAFKEFASHGRMVGYADIPGDRTPEIEWLRANPHRLHLGRIGFRLTHADGSAAAPSDITEVRQTLDLWNGVIVSHFRFDGEPVDVETASHPALDGVGVKVRSPLLGTGRLAIEFRFPYGTGQMTAADWTKPEAHRTVLCAAASGRSPLRPHARRRRLPRRGPLGARRHDGGGRPARVRPVGGARVGHLRGHVDLHAEAAGGTSSRLRRHQRGGARALEPLLVHRRRYRPLRAARTRAGVNSSGASCCRST